MSQLQAASTLDGAVHAISGDEVRQLAAQYMVDGVSSNGRYDHALDRPLDVDAADGARFTDVDGNVYIDYHLSNGAVLIGHNDASVRTAIVQALDTGVLSGYDTRWHGQLAQQLCSLVPSAELVRFTNSGTEATLLALRLARAYTNRSRILKFAGHFHGLHEFVMFNTRASACVPGGFVDVLPSSKGVPSEIARLVDVVGWNDFEAVRAAFQSRGSEYAAVICEPIPINAGCISPAPGFLEFLLSTANEYGTLLIFDEILSGFRTGTSCTQGELGVTPHLTTLGKALTNGLPIGVVAGQRPIMEMLGRVGGVAHSGTFSGFPISVLGGIACLSTYSRPHFFHDVIARAARLREGIQGVFARHGLPCAVNGYGSRFKLFIGVHEPVADFATAQTIDFERELQLFRALARRGIYFHHSRVGLGHHGISAAHTDLDVAITLEAFADALAKDM